MVDKCYKLELKQGQTVFIPTGTVQLVNVCNTILFTPRLDPRRLHPGQLSRVRRQLPPLPQHPAAAAGLRAGGQTEGPAQVQVPLLRGGPLAGGRQTQEGPGGPQLGQHGTELCFSPVLHCTAALPGEPAARYPSPGGHTQVLSAYCTLCIALFSAGCG